MKFTRKSYLELWLNGEYVSRHTSLIECAESALNHAGDLPDEVLHYLVTIGGAPRYNSANVYYEIEVARTDITIFSTGNTPANARPQGARAQALASAVSAPNPTSNSVDVDITGAQTRGRSGSAVSSVTNPSAGGKRWHPGHYLKVQGDPFDSGYESTTLTRIDQFMDDDPLIIGCHVAVPWGTFNPTGQNYDWTFFDQLRDRCAQSEKYLIAQIQVKSFNNHATPTLEAPADLISLGQVIPHGNSDNDGQVFCMWRDGTGGFPDNRGRYLQALTAIRDRYDNDDHPNNKYVEWINGTETALGLGSAAPADYTLDKFEDALEYIYLNAGLLYEKINFGCVMNTLGDPTGSNNRIPNLLEQAYQTGCAFACPDARSEAGYEGFMGIQQGPVPLQRPDYIGLMGCLTVASASVIDPNHRPSTPHVPPAEVILNEQAHGTTHLSWIHGASGDGDWSSQILPAINNNPSLLTSCPDNLPSCDTGTVPSGVITAVTFNMATVRNTAPGNSAIAEESDNWPITWASDGNQYTSFGDGEGFHNLSGQETTRASIGWSRISGTKDNYSAQDMGKSGKLAGGLNGKCYGMLGANSKLYCAWDFRGGSGNDGSGSREDRYDASTICSSTDWGATWSEVIRWDSNDWGNDLNGFYSPTFLQFGQDYANPRDEYVYVYVMEHDNDIYEVQDPGGISLMRCLLTNLESGVKNHWEYVVALDANHVPQWSTNINNRISVFTDPDGNDVASVIYNYGIGRYILTTFHKTRDINSPTEPTAYIGIYDAPQPWGPWNTALRQDVAKVGPDLGDGPNVIFWNFSQKWMSANGRNFVMVGTLPGKDEWGTVEGTFTFQA